MDCYIRLTLHAFDRVAFAHSLAAADYHYSLENHGYSIYGTTPPQGGVLEIGFVEENPLILTTEQGQYRIPENHIFIIPPDCSFSVRSQFPGLHRHTTAEFLIRGECVFVDDYAPPKGQAITLPAVIPPCPDSAEVFSLIRAISNAKTGKIERSWFSECADFMFLLNRLCLMAETTSSDSATPGSRRYCERAKTFISENIHRRVTVGEVADAVGVSKNYLTNLFSACEGMPLMEYTNRRKLGYMIQLVRRYGYTLAQAADQVGYNDVSYVSRIFRKYYGVSFSEYMHRKE